MIRALIVDDEPLAREAIRDLLLADREFQIAGECQDGAEAVRAIQALAPDAVFLDVQMPVLDGFAVIDAVGVDRMPLTVFVTAYDQYAVKAFEAQALDYILKPFDEERVARVLQRLKSRFRDLVRTPEPSDRIALKTAGRVVLAPRATVRWFGASGNQVKVYTTSETLVIRDTIKNLESRLDGDKFVRIHRSTIVNVDHVREIRPWYTGEYVVVMSDSRELTLSRGYRTNLPRLRSPRSRA
ncbi:MAG TPA: LytTR family transcriptional regulator DNA-binding domain-containing protein [Bryobacteraceae bacterium]|nr:LytTR family transcriptional regulator DNA-binding domain-containing protein [Bryobacteraceae bacterium]